MAQQTFDFGNGPIPAHCHKNPNGSEGGWVAETAHVDKAVYVGKDARIYGNVRIFDKVRIFGNARAYGNAQISGSAWIFGNARIWGNAWISDNVQISGNAWISDNAQISGDARIWSNARISGNVKISRTEQVLTIGPIGSEDGTLTVVFDDDDKIWCSRGCFGGSPEEFQAAVREKRRGDKHGKEYEIIIETIKKLAPLRRKS